MPNLILPVRTYVLNAGIVGVDFTFDVVSESAGLTSTTNLTAEADVLRNVYQTLVGQTSFNNNDIQVNADLTDSKTVTFVGTFPLGIRHPSSSSLSSEFSIEATNVFEGDIIQQFDMVSSFGITAAPVRIKSASKTLTGVFSKTQTPNLISSTDSSIDVVFNQTAYPFGLFVDTDPTTLVSRATSTVATDLFEGVFVNLTNKFNLTDGTEFIEGTNRKFTTAQISAITSNSTQIVDFVEIILNYEDIDLLVGEQIRIPPVLRWNSSGRDLNIIDYKNNNNHYKGKNVLMRLPSFEYNGMFTKKTVKIEINGLLRYFNQAMILGYLNYAPITMGKAVFNYDLGTVTQIGSAVLLQRGHINSFTLSGSTDQQSTTIEVDSGFYNYDRRVATRTNSASYNDYLSRASEFHGISYIEPNKDDVGQRILDKITWGADVVV